MKEAVVNAARKLWEAEGLDKFTVELNRGPPS